MRAYWSALAGVLLWTTVASAQQPPQPPQPPAAPALDPRNPLDALLMRWEAEMKKVESIAAQCTRTDDDKTFQVTTTHVGAAKFLKPNLALLEMQQKDNPARFERYILSGTFLYEYRPEKKEIWVHQLPPPKPGQLSDDNCFSLLFGMKAEEAKRRYVLQLDRPEDPYYYYVNILPRFEADKADFQRAQLVLTKDSFMPRRLWFEQPNKSTVSWDIPKVEINGALARREFEKPEPPAGWKLVPQTRADQIQPRVIRQNQQ